MKIHRARTPVLEIAYEESEAQGNAPVVLLHGFPYDPRSFDAVVPVLAANGLRTIVPYVRGYGATRFLSPEAMRSGQQAAVAHDVLDLLDALKIERAVLAGFDWGARSACILAALWPERVIGLLTCSGYHIQDIAHASKPDTPDQEERFWYQYYFHTERGRRGLVEKRDDICRHLWKLWSPSARIDDATFARTAESFRNPDFVDVVVHSYRHRHGNAPGDPRYEETERKLAALPKIAVPAITLHGAEDGVHPPHVTAGHGKFFTGKYERRVLEGIGHDPAREAPSEFARAVIELAGKP